MTTEKKIKRKYKIKMQKLRIKELLENLNLSKRKFQSLKVKVTGESLDYKKVDPLKGHKPSLASQYSLLCDVYQDKLKDEKILEELKKQIDKKEENQDENNR